MRARKSRIQQYHKYNYTEPTFKEPMLLHWIMGIAIDVLVMVPQLIAIIDSMGALPLVMSMLNMNQALVFNRALRIIAIAVPTLLVFFTITRPYVLTAFNISIADFRIAGGIVLLVIGIDTLREGAPRTMGLNPEDYVFVPSHSHACWS